MQNASFDLSQLHQLAKSTVLSLEHDSTGTQLKRLDVDLADSLSSFDIPVREDQKTHFKNQIFQPFVKAFATHIEERLPDTDIFAAFLLFDLHVSKLPAFSAATALESYGEAYVDVLINQ